MKSANIEIKVSCIILYYRFPFSPRRDVNKYQRHSRGKIVFRFCQSGRIGEAFQYDVRDMYACLPLTSIQVLFARYEVLRIKGAIIHAIGPHRVFSLRKFQISFPTTTQNPSNLYLRFALKSQTSVKQERSTAFDWSSSTDFAAHFHILGILPIQGAVNHNQSQMGL